MKLFDLDAPIVQRINKIAVLMWIGCLWAVCSLPVMTAGAASAAMYRMAFNLREGGVANAGAFFQAFRSCFRKSTALWLLLLPGAAALFFGYRGVLLIPGDMLRLGLLAALGVLFLVWGVVGIYAFPLTAYFENTVKNTLRNAFLMGMGHLRSSIPCFAIAMLPVLALLISPWWFLRLLYAWILLYPAFAAYWIACVLRPVFAAYIPGGNE